METNETAATIVRAWREPKWPAILRVRFSFTCPGCGTNHQMEDGNGADLPVHISYGLGCCKIGAVTVIFQTGEPFLEDDLVLNERTGRFGFVAADND